MDVKKMYEDMPEEELKVNLMNWKIIQRLKGK